MNNRQGGNAKLRQSLSENRFSIENWMRLLEVPRWRAGGEKAFG